MPFCAIMKQAIARIFLQKVEGLANPFRFLSLIPLEIVYSYYFYSLVGGRAKRIDFVLFHLFYCILSITKLFRVLLVFMHAIKPLDVLINFSSESYFPYFCP